MKISVSKIEEPLLEFGNGYKSFDARDGLERGGPIEAGRFPRNSVIRLGLIAPPDVQELMKGWIERGKGLIIDDEANRLKNRPFPGVEKAFGCEFEISARHTVTISVERIKSMVTSKLPSAFDELLKLYHSAIDALLSDPLPDVILVYFPEAVAAYRISNPRLTQGERMFLERMQRDAESDQLQLFEPTPQEIKDYKELVPQAEDLLFRQFHRALKASCMMRRPTIPIQVFRDQTVVDNLGNQSASTRAWNFFLAVFYKAGRIPWKPVSLNPKTCFVGISFHHLKRRKGDLVYASVAQAFSSEVEPFALKGVNIPREQTLNKQPYLLEEQADGLINDILEKYEMRVGTPPNRIVIHKSSSFTDSEVKGFCGKVMNKVAAVDLVWLRPTMFRMVRKGGDEPERGTICTLSNRKTYLFTTGFIQWWMEYPGPHIPSPFEIGVSSGGDIRQAAEEILALTKMNWNSADGIGKNPITLGFAKHVGLILTELDEDDEVNPLYRYYM